MGIAMAGNADVSWLPDVSGALDMPDTLIESPVIRSRQQNVGEVQPGNFKPTQHFPPAVSLHISRKSRTGFDNRFLPRLRCRQKPLFSSPLGKLRFQRHKYWPGQKAGPSQECNPMQRQERAHNPGTSTL